MENSSNKKYSGEIANTLDFFKLGMNEMSRAFSSFQQNTKSPEIKGNQISFDLEKREEQYIKSKKQGK
ncbi:MAG TPA: hypothetical protein PKC14_01725 [Candidatus Absconditabacterales bacterium]|nr:hypothetical protein [Candidatus Absconditabacterales bacterium]